MLQQTNNKIDGVLAANDGLGQLGHLGAQARKLKQIPVTGQDATAQGIQHILAGEQCMTVYKAVKEEADAAAEAGDRAGQGRRPRRPTRRPTTRAPRRPSVLLTPVAVTKANIKDTVIKDGFLKRARSASGSTRRSARRQGSSYRMATREGALRRPLRRRTEERQTQ